MKSDNPVVDVVVPVYAGLEETRACLESVLAAPVSVPFELVVIDDASPEPALSALLDEWAGKGAVHLERHAENLGFVAAANRGLGLHPARDVVLLNSDTQVAGDWLGRLRACALAHEDIASVSPFSNNATILSYPLPGRANALPEGLDTAALNAMFTRENFGEAIDIPVSVGFCMYLRRPALEAVGLFDAERFGKGYGEECDWCLRAAATGWRHRLCGDTFVYHAGGVSFSDRADALSLAAQETLHALYPHYRERVMAHEVQDPARPLRSAVDRARARRGGEAAVSVLTERQLEISGLQAERVRAQERLAALRQEYVRTLDALRERDLALAQAQGFVREREAELATLQCQLEGVIAEHQRTCELLADREQQLNTIKASLLWRLARKLRAFNQ